MPELPEVETVRKDLQRVLRGKRVAEVKISKPKIIKGSAAAFARNLSGRTINGVRRRGKLLIIELKDENKWILIHLKMTGQLIYRDEQKIIAGGHGWPLVEKLPNKYSHVVITFSDKTQLFFNDMRQFGYQRLVNEQELGQVLEGYGPEPLLKQFTADYLYEVLRGRKTALKNILLNQALIAGLGNIYVDEACWRARVRPTKQAGRVTEAEARRLHKAIVQVLREAVAKRGTTFGDYRDGLGGEGNFVKSLKVYGRAGESCKRCKQTKLKKVKIGGRGTVYCPNCQK